MQIGTELLVFLHGLQISHGNQPTKRPPAVLFLATAHDVVHDDTVALHDFARYQYASSAARRLLLDGLDAFAELAGPRPPKDSRAVA